MQEKTEHGLHNPSNCVLSNCTSDEQVATLDLPASSESPDGLPLSFCFTTAEGATIKLCMINIDLS